MTRDKGRDGPEAGGFARRWSRRKLTVREKPEATPAAEAAQAPAEDKRSDAEILVALGLPEPEALKPGDDFSAFMARAVPARLRNRALRRLWRLNPTLAALDGLVDYDDDFTDAAMVVENLQTAYQVGRGWADRIGEAAAAAADPEAGESQPQAEPADAEAGAALPAGGPANSPAGALLADAGAPLPGEVRAPAPARIPRRRMRFRFPEG